jgi:glycosyltransferase involved in cell wall biosynthesis
MISVIIPTYNRRALLAETLAGVFAQTETDYEVIVVDDGSTDGTVEFLRAQPVQVVSRPHVGRPAAARNAGLERARGDLIAFLDSDDVWEPTTLAELRAALAAAPQAGFSFCDYTYFDSQLSDGALGNDGCLPAHCRLSGDIFPQLLETDFLVTGGLLIRRAAVEAVGRFDERCYVAEDWDYWLRLAAQFQGACLAQRLVRLRAHPAGLSHRPGGVVLQDNKLIGRKMLDYCRAARRDLVPAARRLYRRSLYEAARYHWHHGSRLQTARDLMRLFYAG